MVVEISDNGPGIAAEILPRIFESFFTTKPRGMGTGLGLPISLGIVRTLGGEIIVDSRAGAGGDLPRAAARRREQRPGAPVDAGAGARRTATRAAGCWPSTTRRCCSRPTGACSATRTS